MATCSRIQSECQTVLYRENVVRMTVSYFIYVYRHYFRKPCEHRHGMDPFLHKRLQETKCFEIVYADLSEPEIDDLPTVPGNSQIACRFMSELKDIRSVSLNLAAVNSYMKRWYIVHRWSSLRNVGRVAVNKGELPISKTVVEEFMKNAIRKVPLLRAYFALERYGKPHNCCSHLLSNARLFAEQNDLENFKIARAKIIAEVEKTRDRLLDYDP